MPTLSLCLIAKNEEENLSRCLESVQNLVDEMVIVDTGSTDKTLEIARSFDANVVQSPWEDNFSAARNQGLKKAKSDWILVLDADEYLTPESQPSIQKAMSKNSVAGVNVLIKNLLSNEDLFESRSNRFVRLFRRSPHIQFEGRVHEQVLPSIRRSGGDIVDRDDIVILHHGYMEQGESRRDRQQRNLRILIEEIKDHPEDAFIHYHLGVTHQSLDQIQNAIQSLERSIQKSEVRNKRVPNSQYLPPDIEAKAHTRLAQLYLAQNRLEEAIRHCERSVQNGSIDPLTYFLTAVIHMHTYNFSTATQVLERGLDFCQNGQSIESNIRMDQLRMILAHCKKLDGKPKEAILDYQSCAEENPENLDAWIGLGECRMQTKNFSNARIAFSRALDLDPESETAQQGLQLCGEEDFRP